MVDIVLTALRKPCKGWVSRGGIGANYPMVGQVGRPAMGRVVRLWPRYAGQRFWRPLRSGQGLDPSGCRA